jgi:hypothetical protein
MGSILPRPHPEGRALLLHLERVINKSIAETGDFDLAELAAIVDNYLDDLSKRDKVVLYLTAYLAHCLKGHIPDISIWIP